MSKTYRAYEPEQLLLMPPSIMDWLAPGHLAHFVSDLVESLDLHAITSTYEEEERGYPPYHPVMMTKVLVYAYCVGVTSSRRVAREMQEHVAFRMLAANNTPDFRTVASFRRIHSLALRGLFLQVLQLCSKAGLVKLDHVALDGTKIKANASKQRSMTYGEMKEVERDLQSKLERYFKDAQEIDAREDELYGADKRGDELPEDLRESESRLRKIRELKAVLEREAQEAAEERKMAIKARQTQGPKPGRPLEERTSEPKADKQRNSTDADSRLLPYQGRFVQGYNCQAAVDDKHQVIVAADVKQEARDARYAGPMIEEVIANLGRPPKKASMDAGYSSKEAITAVEGFGCEAFIASGDRKPAAKRSIISRMRRKLNGKRGRAIYLRRQCIVEPVFGQIKEGRGFRQFLLRGLEKVKTEWALICTGHNLLKLWRSLGPLEPAGTILTSG